MFKKVRVTILLYVLLMVALATWLTKVRSTDWDNSLWLTVYPINGDLSERSQDYISKLSPKSFEPLETFLQREAGRYGIALERPLRVEIGEQLKELPPTPPVDANPLKVIAWSLKLRYWSYRVQRSQEGPSPDIQMFVVYHDPDRHPVLAHSLGLEKGLIGVVNGFASRQYTSQNNVVIAHELLHTLGASDKYDPETSAPAWPYGYADPGKDPLHPQKAAEIMGGRTPLSEGLSEMPRGLKDCVVGPLTAREINWIQEWRSDYWVTP
jgi:hypothetical protein